MSGGHLGRRRHAPGPGGPAGLAAGQAAVESVGGTLETMFWAFGDTDVYGIADFPDDASAVAFWLMINSTGSMSGTVTPLLTADDLDAASSKNPSYRAPGE